LKIVGMLVGVVLILVGGLLTWLALRSPAQRPASAEKVAPTPDRLARGKYLAENVIQCMDCHSDHDDTKYTWPARPETYGQGGFTFDEKLGLPGSVSAQNITPDPETGLGSWSDGEIMRAFREGVSKDGHALFAMMPYPLLRRLSDEDARSIVVYLRSLKPIRKDTPPVSINFPVNLLMKLDPQPLDGPVAAPSPSDSRAYGDYLAHIAGCIDCHTQHKNGKPIDELEFAGGWVFKGPWGTVVSPNITPDAETGIGSLTREAFIGRFKSFASMTELPPPPKGKNTIMNWKGYAQMPEADLGAIYDYLRTIKPIKNLVNKFPDAI
jgi:mono/diheme cytochrome c family protein